MTAKHTKGPWVWLEDRYRGGFSGIVSDDGTEVLFPSTANEGDTGAAWYEDLPTEANAHLIAAAPELLEALEMIRDADDDCARDGLPRIPSIARAKVDAAIAKAKGEASS